MDPQTAFNLVIAVITVLVSGDFLISKVRKRRETAETKKIDAETNKAEIEAAAQISEAALSILRQARSDAEHAGAEAKKARIEMESLRAEISRLYRFCAFLENFIRKHGIMPPTVEDMERELGS